MMGTQPYTYAPYAGETSQAQQHVLLQRVSFLLASSLVVSALGAYLFQAAYGLWLPFFIASLALIFVMRAVARKPGLNVLVFYAFSLIEGGMLGPLVALYAHRYGGGLVWEAFLLTAITVAGVGGYAYTSRRDFGFLGRGLLIALVVLLVAGLALCFVATPAFHTTTIGLGFEILIVGLFVGFLLYDFSNIRRRYSPEDYILATVAVYLDFVNLFLAILQILGAVQGGGRRR